MPLDQEQRVEQDVERVVERMGLFFEQDGMPRIAGRLLGYLLLSKEPRSLDELAEELQISKSSASTNARLLERMGSVERVTAPGDRRDFYQIADKVPAQMSELWLERLTGMRDLLGQALGTTAAGSKTVRRRLKGGVRLMEALAEAVEAATRDFPDADQAGGDERGAA